MPNAAVRANGRTMPKFTRAKTRSLYEIYPLPFFDRKRLLTWAAEPTGRYSEDCETGRAFAIEFLKSNDGTHGWAALLRSSSPT
jgi:hypothetical protein